MKIEKINDKQIRCTLTGDDLSSRQIKLSELAYGTEKAKALFQDMMQQAKKEFGFEPDNAPIMVEAIPTAPDSIVLIITKVDDPEELDTRFSRFSEALKEELTSAPEKHFAGADDILDLFRKICDAKESASEDQETTETARDGKDDKEDSAKESEKEVAPLSLIQLFQFSNLDEVIEAAHGLHNFYNEYNSLYKDTLTGNYLLVVNQDNCSPEDFNKVSNMLSEYSDSCMFAPSAVAFLDEHTDCILRGNAIQTLSEL